jgi:hypothetical protein
MAKSANDRIKYPVDQMMWNVASSLVRDFQATFDDPGFCCSYSEVIHSRNIARFRKVASTVNANENPAKFKAEYQMQSLFKRYRFEIDTYSDDELEEKAIHSFLQTQVRIRNLDFTSLDEDTMRVVDRARTYIAKLLGRYSDEEHRNLCRFGSKASVGIPLRKACLAARWELPISGSPDQISWFDSEMSSDTQVQDYWTQQKRSDPSKGGSTYQETRSLTLTLVPKTFKSLRAIMPNTTIGSYMSYGLGEMLRKRLRRAGYDIRTLQKEHRILARLASEHSLFTTADLSSASDSISVQLVELLFPSDWVNILKQSRIGQVILPDKSIYCSETFCTMGIGYTFPLQTLVFLALLKAIEANLYNRWNRRTVSVYGDDLIYSSPMHYEVVRVFERLGFVINVDKTFHEGHFRESCGGDYYYGVDVRPFQPKNGSVTVGSKTYEAMLYKYVNGLLARWSEHEIGRTLLYLTTEIEKVTGKCKLVPCDYPDDSGIKCPTLRHWNFLQCSQVAQPVHLGHGVYRFSYLRLVPDEREEVRHGPYLWLALRGGEQYACPFSSAEHRFGGLPTNYQLTVDYAVKVMEDVSPLRRKVVKPIEMIRSDLRGHRLRRVATFVTISKTGRYMRRSGTSCFEDRR